MFVLHNYLRTIFHLTIVEKINIQSSEDKYSQIINTLQQWPGIIDYGLQT